MHTQVNRQGTTTGRRWATRVVAVAAVAAAGLGTMPGSASAAPVNPSDAQLSQAQQAQQDAAAQATDAPREDVDRLMRRRHRVIPSADQVGRGLRQQHFHDRFAPASGRAAASQVICI